jgi:NTP pyrophosphatase (non-canonical NTP hydrolase)
LKLTEYDGTNLNLMRDIVGDFNIKQGWRDKSDAITKVLEDNAPSLVPVFENYLIGTMIALIHSELSEALEAQRKNLMDDHLPNRKGIEAELADAIIRIFDLSAQQGLDIGGAVVEKFLYNMKRPDHKKENRALPGGKSF